MKRFLKSSAVQISLILILVGGLGLVWGTWKVPEREHVLEFGPEEMTLEAEYEGVRLAVLEERVMTLRYPKWVRAGDPAKVRLTFEAKPEVGSQPDFYDLQAVHDVYVETSLSLAKFEIQPRTTAEQRLPEGRTVTFWWTIVGDDVGIFDGTGWLGLRMVPRSGGPEAKRALAAPKVEVEVRRLGFLNGAAARTAGAGGAALGMVIILIFWRRAK